MTDKPKRPSKFSTHAKAHADARRKGHRVKPHGYTHPKKRKSAALPEHIEQYIAEHGPYMYHLVHGDGQDVDQVIPLILRDGILPRGVTNVNAFDDYLASRPNHAYIGNEDLMRQHVGDVSHAQIRVDLRKIDPRMIDVDEDHALTAMQRGTQLPGKANVYPATWEHFQNREEYPEMPFNNIGEWADKHENILDHPEWVNHSLWNGSVAVRGGIPPEALSLNTGHANYFPAEGEQHPATPPAYAKTAMGLHGDLPEGMEIVVEDTSDPKLNWTNIHYRAMLNGQEIGHLRLTNNETRNPYTNRPERTHLKDMRVHWVGVKPEYQRMGVASALMERARQDFPDLKHSDTLTEDGKAWSEHVGSDFHGEDSPASAGADNQIDMTDHAGTIDTITAPTEAPTPRPNDWVYINGHVQFTDNLSHGAYELALKLGLPAHEASRLSNLIARNDLLSEPNASLDLGVGTTVNNRPQIWHTTVDRNALYDAVSRALRTEGGHTTPVVAKGAGDEGDEVGVSESHPNPAHAREANGQIMYHYAPTSARQSIAEHGLDYTKGEMLPNIGWRWDEELGDEVEHQFPNANYLYRTFESAREALPPNYDLYEVDVEGLELQVDPYEDTEAVYTLEPIGPERLRLIDTRVAHKWRPSPRAAKKLLDHLGVEAKFPKTKKCKFCKEQATHRIIHAEGRAYVPCCDAHIEKAKSAIDEPSDINRIEKWSVVDHQQVLDANRGTHLTGLPTKPVNVAGQPLTFTGHAGIQQIANQYNTANRLGEHPSDYLPVNPQTAAQIADEYEKMEHRPHDPEVRAAYDALKRECVDQYRHALDNGYRFDFYPDHDPYPNSPREAVLDLHHNKRMYVYPTVGEGGGYGNDEQDQYPNHPLLEYVPDVQWSGKPVTYNDVFRAIHDFYGHAKEGLGFRADGEDNAFRQHSAMFSPLAQRALTSETRGQNSWVNYGPHGEHNQTATHDTIYAPQKAGLMPEWVSDPNLHANAPQALTMASWRKAVAPSRQYWEEDDPQPDSMMQYAEYVPIEALKPALEYDRRPNAPKLVDQNGEELTQAADPEYWERLKASMAKHGPLAPVWLQYDPDSGHAYVGEGNHRVRIAEELGMTHLPVMLYRTRRGQGFGGAHIKLKPLGGQLNEYGYEQHVPQYIRPSDVGLPVREVNPKQASAHPTLQFKEGDRVTERLLTHPNAQRELGWEPVTERHGVIIEVKFEGVHEDLRPPAPSQEVAETAQQAVDALAPDVRQQNMDDDRGAWHEMNEQLPESAKQVIYHVRWDDNTESWTGSHNLYPQHVQSAWTKTAHHQTHDRGHKYEDRAHHALTHYVLHSAPPWHKLAYDAEKAAQKRTQLLEGLSKAKWWSQPYDPRHPQHGDIVVLKKHHPVYMNSTQEQELLGKLGIKALRAHNPRVEPGTRFQIDDLGYANPVNGDVYISIEYLPDADSKWEEWKGQVKDTEGDRYQMMGSTIQHHLQQGTAEIVQRATPSPYDQTNLEAFTQLLGDAHHDLAPVYKWMAREFQRGNVAAGNIHALDELAQWVEWQRRYGNADMEDSTINFASPETTFADARQWMNRLQRMGLDPQTNHIEWEHDPIWKHGNYAIAPLSSEDEEEFQRHGMLMDQCISSTDEQPYYLMDREGHWQHYAVRDKTGRPHGTICMAQSNGINRGSTWTIIENRGNGNARLDPHYRSDGAPEKYGSVIDEWLMQAEEKGGITIDREFENHGYAPEHPTHGLRELGLEFDGYGGLRERRNRREYNLEPRDDHDRMGHIEPGDLDELENYADSVHSDPEHWWDSEPDYEDESEYSADFDDESEVAFYDPGNELGHPKYLKNLIDEMLEYDHDERDEQAIMGHIANLHAYTSHYHQLYGGYNAESIDERVKGTLEDFSTHAFHRARQADNPEDQRWGLKVSEMLEHASTIPYQSMPGPHNNSYNVYDPRKHFDKVWEPWTAKQPQRTTVDPQTQQGIYPVFEGDQSTTQGPRPWYWRNLQWDRARDEQPMGWTARKRR